MLNLTPVYALPRPDQTSWSVQPNLASLTLPAPVVSSVPAVGFGSKVAAPAPARTDLLVPESSWGWEQVRDYVVTQIVDRFGPFPRDSKREYGIFSRFTSTHGPVEAIRIARYAFEVCDGWWCGAPISVTRFCKGSDEYFSRVILNRLAEAS